MSRGVNIGFTGTQEGMTELQKSSVQAILEYHYHNFTLLGFRHGDCIGSEDEFDALALELINKYHKPPEHSFRPWIHIHPPINRSKVANTYVNRPYECRLLLNFKEYLERNKDIVIRCNVMIATPKGYTEEQRSGTWATIRYARKMKRETYIVWPDGTIKIENQVK